MIYAVLEKNGREKAFTFDRWPDYFAATFSPETITKCLIDFVIHGKTYKERKSSLEDMAIEYSNNAAAGLYMSDVIAINNFFETNGRRYGLLTEFKENCIC